MSKSTLFLAAATASLALASADNLTLGFTTTVTKAAVNAIPECNAKNTEDETVPLITDQHQISSKPTNYLLVASVSDRVIWDACAAAVKTALGATMAPVSETDLTACFPAGQFKAGANLSCSIPPGNVCQTGDVCQDNAACTARPNDATPNTSRCDWPEVKNSLLKITLNTNQKDYRAPQYVIEIGAIASSIPNAEGCEKVARDINTEWPENKKYIWVGNVADIELCEKNVNEVVQDRVEIFNKDRKAGSKLTVKVNTEELKFPATTCWNAQTDALKPTLPTCKGEIKEAPGATCTDKVQCGFSCKDKVCTNNALVAVAAPVLAATLALLAFF